ncbi:MAG: FAD-binding oxidoreductase [Thalassobaculaceae bacterium]|nr:FAD-binding oxidoreductase [Thalassobaculaceae bacterium]
MNVDAPSSVPASAIRDAIAALKQVLGDKGWLEEPTDTLKYRTDWRGGSVGEALLVARPDSTAQVSDVVRICHGAGIAVTAQGGNTGLVLGSIPTEPVPSVVVSLERMTRIRSLDADNFALVAEAGCVIQTLQQAAAEVGRLYPLSLASEGSSTVGGTLSTNAGGNNTIKFGNAREQVLGLEVVLPDGTVFDGLNTLRKNNTGYDLKHLFIGAEGTLGIITAAAMRLMPGPKKRETAMLSVPNPEAAQVLLSRARELSGDTVIAFELMPRRCIDLAMEYIEGIVDPIATPSPWYVLMEMATSSEIDDLRAKLEAIFGEAMERELVTDGVIAESETQRAQIWRIREEQAEAGRRAGSAISCDVSVPVSRVAEFLARAKEMCERELEGVVLNTFGHMGDGNIHYGIRKPDAMSVEAWAQRKGDMSDKISALCAEFGGSFSAEHGIGGLKRDDFRRYTPQSRVDLMQAIKAAIDPDGVMNPGKIF